ncbi:MAG: hypothetical protein Q8O67_13175 [Deltaproteobacteria bacterium]|nr:hypothetical protein [Deltaproteobacteria bacterium]
MVRIFPAWVVVVVVVFVGASAAHANNDAAFATACEAARSRQLFSSVTVDAPSYDGRHEKPTPTEIAACFGRDTTSPFALKVKLRPREWDASAELMVVRPNGLPPVTITVVADQPDGMTRALTKAIAELLTRDDVRMEKTAEDTALCQQLTAAKASVVLLLSDRFVLVDDSPAPPRTSVATPLGSTLLSEAIRKSCIVVADGLAGAPLPDVIARFGPLAVRGEITVKDTASLPPQPDGSIDPRLWKAGMRGANGSVLASMHSYSIVVSFDVVDATTERRLLKRSEQVQAMGISPEHALKSERLKALTNDLARVVARALVEDLGR